MKRHLMKIISMLLVFSFWVGNTAVAQAAEKTHAEQEMLNQENWENLITKIEEIKRDNPDASEEQIVKTIDRMLKVRSSEMRGITDIWNALTESEKKLCICYPFDALKVNKARSIATSQTETKFGYSGLGDRSDAFRHGIWNAEMAILIGEEKAELFATAHEDKDTTGTESDGFNKIEHKNMDLHNNAVGRAIGIANLNASESEIADIIYNSIYQEGTEFIWLHE